MPSTTAISVIIPALNEADTIERAIQSAWAAGATEVIVVDGGSHDETPSIALALRCQVVTTRPGRAVQQNAGALQASGEILLFLHADCSLGPDCLVQVTGVFSSNHRIVAGAFQQQIGGSRIALDILALGNAARVRWFGLAYGDQGIFIRRTVFSQIGGFPNVPLMEDVMLVRKLRSVGRIQLVRGPIHVSPRRWQRHGVMHQTARNWCLLAAFLCGVPPAKLQRFYLRHDRLRGHRDPQPS